MMSESVEDLSKIISALIGTEDSSRERTYDEVLASNRVALGLTTPPDQDRG